MFAGSEALRSQKLEDFVVGLVGFKGVVSVQQFAECGLTAWLG